MKNIKYYLQTLLLFCILFSATAFGQAKTAMSKVTHLGSVKLDSIQLGINRLDKLKKTFEENGIKFAKGSSALENDASTEVEFVQYELTGPISISSAATMLEFMGYKPATFEEAASIDSVTFEKVAGKRVHVLGTQMMLGGSGKSVIFSMKYSLTGSGESKGGVEIQPRIVTNTEPIDGTVILAMIRVK